MNDFRLKILIIGFLFLSFVLRFFPSLNKTLWLDEAVSISVINKGSLKEIIEFCKNDRHPPLYYFILSLLKRFSEKQRIMIARLISASFSSFTLIFLFLLARAIAGKEFALVVSFLYMISPFHIWYGGEIRMYSMLAFFSTWSFYIVFTGNHKFGRKKVLTLIILTMCGLYTHYYYFFVIFAQIFFILLFKRRFENSCKRLIISIFLGMLTFLPWLPVFVSHLKAGLAWNPVFTIKQVPLTFAKFALSHSGKYLFINSSKYFIAFIFWSFFIPFIAGCYYLYQKQEALLFILMSLFIPIVLMGLIAFSASHTFYLPKYCLPFSIFFIMLIAGGVIEKRIGGIRYLVFTVVIILMMTSNIIYFLTDDIKAEWRSITEFVNNLSPSSEYILFYPCYYDIVFKLYYKEYKKKDVKILGVTENSISSVLSLLKKTGAVSVILIFKKNSSQSILKYFNSKFEYKIKSVFRNFYVIKFLNLRFSRNSH